MEDYPPLSATAYPDATITVLPVDLSLVHIPRRRLTALSHPIIKLILRPNPVFLNVSCNDTEVSIFAQQSDLTGFEKIAERDERRRQRSGAKPGSKRPLRECIQMSPSWSALQIDSHSIQLGDATARIREISALLSGISILYQSSYTTDYIFVQSRLLPIVTSILSNANFTIHSTIPSEMESLVSNHSSSGPSTRSPSPGLISEIDHFEAPIRSRRGTTSSHASLHSLLLATSGVDLKDDVRSLSPIASPPPTFVKASPTPHQTPLQPLSPCNPQVAILPSELVVVGLSEQVGHPEAWTMKLIKMLLFRDVIYDEDRGREQWIDDDRSSSSSASMSSSSSQASFTDEPEPPLPFFSLTRTSDGPSLTTDVRLLAALFPPGERHLLYCAADTFTTLESEEEDPFPEERYLKCLHVDLREYGLDRYGLVNRFTDVLHSHEIHHLYSSTFKTANLLVYEKDADRALKLLQDC